jgi:hypothetical protein
MVASFVDKNISFSPRACRASAAELLHEPEAHPLTSVLIN